MQTYCPFVYTITRPAHGFSPLELLLRREWEGREFVNRYIRVLGVLTIGASALNVGAWLVDWARSGADYFGAGFWALIPQLILTVALVYGLKTKRAIAGIYLFSVTFILWLVTFLINGWGWLSISQYGYPAWWGWLEMFGVDAFQIFQFRSAPLYGLFHSTKGDVSSPFGWYFDGGISFSWLIFNLLSVVLMVSLFANHVIDRRAMSPEVAVSSFCTQCGRVRLSVGSFCSGCGARFN